MNANTFPVVNLLKCDGDARCIDLCPNDVFEIYTLSKDQVKKLSFKGRLKVKIKGANKARAVNATDCIACGLCVDKCHEKAIELITQ